MSPGGVAIAALALAAAGCASDPEVVSVVGAASLRPVLERLVADLQDVEPDSRYRVQTGGSSALVRRVAELDLRADVLVLADPLLFDLLPSGEWSAVRPLASDQLVLALRPGLEPTDDWAALVATPGIRVAMAHPDTAPLGYRTLIALRLFAAAGGDDLEPVMAGEFARRFVRPDAGELLAPLESGAVDAAFLYRSQAQAARLHWLGLPDAINLGDPGRAAAYGAVSVEVAGGTPGSRVSRSGAPIVYAVAVRRAAPAGARRFADYALTAGAGRFVEAGYRVAPELSPTR